jgi:Bacterial regulatory proteins, gntR family
MIWHGDNKRRLAYRRYLLEFEWDVGGRGGGGGGGGGFATQSEIIADDLRGRLEEGEWASGEALPSNSKLAEEYETSRSTIARVMRTLAEEGLVEIIPRRGAFKR